jgi:chemotaxis protein methyltransferase CheR
MTVTVPRDLLPQLSDFIAAQMGLQFSPARWGDLERGIVSASRQFEFKDPDAFIHQLLCAPLTKSQIEILATHLTVGETYFFRDERAFETLETRILPELIRSRYGAQRQLRIWSAGCATGEEPYSVAILLHKLIPDLERWNITILATDINPAFLEKAARGMYRDWSFRNTPSWVTPRYFQSTNGRGFQVVPAIQKMVKFFYLNLAEDVYPSPLNNINAMDLILCRNVLMYFAPERAASVIRNLHHSLTDGGWLIVSPTETSQVLFSEFRTVHFPGAIFYRKDSREPVNTETVHSQEYREMQGFRAPPVLSAEPVPETRPPSRSDELSPVIAEKPKQQPKKSDACQDGIALYERGRYREASERLLEFLSQNQGDHIAMGLLARAYANLGQLAQALEWCEKAIASDKLNTGCHYLRAIILQEQGAMAQARLSLQKTLYLDPKFVLAHFALGNLSRHLGKTKESEKHFANALSIAEAYRQDEILPESDGLTAGRLAEMIRSTSQQGTSS